MYRGDSRLNARFDADGTILPAVRTLHSTYASAGRCTGLRGDVQPYGMSFPIGTWKMRKIGREGWVERVRTYLLLPQKEGTAMNIFRLYGVDTSEGGPLSLAAAGLLFR